MNKAMMIQMGRDHAKAGKKCTPFDCQDVDKMLFVEMKKQEKPTNWYAAMRGAFNKGWESAYCEMVN